MKKSLYELYRGLKREQWYYYEGKSTNPFKNPFDYTDKTKFVEFIENYFKRGGKTEVLELSGINPHDIRFPDHICSVHFFGTILYHNTNLNVKIGLNKSEVGYEFFPLIWFLITLYHDHFYALEKSTNSKLKMIEDIYEKFSISEKLLDLEVLNLERLSNLRSKYFKYRSSKGRVDHGITAGIVLYDKLLKIREKKQKAHEDELFWDKSLIPKYEIAAEAISLHNIWLPQDDQAKDEYVEAGIGSLDPSSFIPVKLSEFPLFYLLGIVDTLEPLKAYNCVKNKYVLKNLMLEFSDNSFTLSNKKNSGLDFGVMKRKAKSLVGWLDVKVNPKETDDKNTLTLEFR